MMTRAVRDRILKDANGNIGDHLRNHIHLTNCIHLKNHMHKHSPMLQDRSLMRELNVLQRSRSLRDPSASPPSWGRSPLTADMFTIAKSGQVAASVHWRRSSPPHSSTMKGKKKQTSGVNDPLFAKEERSHNDEKGTKETDLANSEQRGRKSHASLEDIPKSLSQQLDEVPGDIEDVASSKIMTNLNGMHNQHERRTSEQPEPSGRVRRRKLRKVRRSQARAVNEASVASNSSVGALGRRMEDGCGENTVTRGAPRNGCGIPWNWSRIHHRGKSFLDMAGRSFSCGLSDSRLNRSQSRNVTDLLPRASEELSSCSKSNAEALPLLVDGSGSQETSGNDYSGELGIFADSLLKQDTESDLASEPQHRNLRAIHKSLTHKYMPRSFRDLVGQNLVVQALSNAVMQRKVGLLYVFYGPLGTGKTSCARILARALNCQSLEHPKPCGFCSSCIAHDLGKSTSIKEVGPVGNFDFESIMDLLDSMMLSQQRSHSHYRVFIFDDCDTLSTECWSAISKVIARAPRRVVFMLICSSLEILPHIIISRCHKFFFPKLKDADIIYALQYIATKEGLEIDKDALKLIVSRSDGSLRDAEMTLEQLSLLGQRISVLLVQESVGLISDEKLVDLLDLALSANTVNTVKNLREIMETGVEPLALMSQLATVITDILAGSYDFTKERCRRRFFKRPTLAKEDMEKLRQALRTLSEAERQLRMSNDKLTWLTAALLQLAPDRQYMLPSSSTDTSYNHSPLASDGKSGRELAAKKSKVGHRRGLDSRMERLHAGSVVDVHDITKIGASTSVDRRKHVGSRINIDVERGNNRDSFGKSHTEIDNIWTDVLDKIQISCIKEFLYQEGKLMPFSYSAAPTAQLVFSSHQTRSKAEKFKAYIVQAFESTFGCPVHIEMSCPSSEGRSSQININNGVKVGTSEIVELASTPNNNREVSRKLSDRASQSERTRSEEQNQCKSLVRSKVSLAHVIQQAEGNRGFWTKRKAVSIAEKLEQENLRLEPKTRSLLCWKASRATRRKFSHLKIRSRRSRSLLKLVSCGRCVSRSPR